MVTRLRVVLQNGKKEQQVQETKIERRKIMEIAFKLKEAVRELITSLRTLSGKKQNKTRNKSVKWWEHCSMMAS